MAQPHNRTSTQKKEALAFFKRIDTEPLTGMQMTEMREDTRPLVPIRWLAPGFLSLLQASAGSTGSLIPSAHRASVCSTAASPIPQTTDRVDSLSDSLSVSHGHCDYPWVSCVDLGGTRPNLPLPLCGPGASAPRTSAHGGVSLRLNETPARQRMLA